MCSGLSVLLIISPSTPCRYAQFYIVCIKYSQLLSNSHLYGICVELETFWPGIREVQKSHLVVKTLAGFMKFHGSIPRRKHALTHYDLMGIKGSIPSALMMVSCLSLLCPLVGIV